LNLKREGGDNLKEDSLWKVSLESLKMRSNIFFIITSLSIFLGSTYYYNKRFPNHKYPEWLEFLKLIG
ncbi:hypothetical protein, partial [Bacillus cereus]|uniref:hypothetical protein n=3 Tax=Bacillus cereus TaxID=1396 RepID=UPI001C3E927E